MANPQKESGHLEIANSIVEKLIAAPLSGAEFRVLFFILRKTWGWNKKEDFISIGQIVMKSQLARRTVCEAMNKLVMKRLLVKKKGYINKLNFNKDYDAWVVMKRSLGSYEKVTGVVMKSQPKVVMKSYPTINNKNTHIKDTITKDSSISLPKNKYPLIENIQENDLLEIAKRYDVPVAFVKSELEDMTIWAESKPNNPKLRGRNWRMTLIGFVKRDSFKLRREVSRYGSKQGIDARNIE